LTPRLVGIGRRKIAWLLGCVLDVQRKSVHFKHRIDHLWYESSAYHSISDEDERMFIQVTLESVFFEDLDSSKRTLSQPFAPGYPRPNHAAPSRCGSSGCSQPFSWLDTMDSTSPCMLSMERMGENGMGFSAAA
jgi:hypothetical protein